MVRLLDSKNALFAKFPCFIIGHLTPITIVITNDCYNRYRQKSRKPSF